VFMHVCMCLEKFISSCGKICASLGIFVYILLCACAHREYGRRCWHRICGLTPGIGGGQIKPLSLENSLGQYKEPWTKLEAR
jgi:hypothetical protein